MRVDWQNLGVEVVELQPLGAHGVTGKGMLPIPVDRVVTLMNVLAFHQTRSRCDPLDCDSCNGLNRLYWWLSDGLTIRERTAHQEYLRSIRVRLPAGPWEDAETTAHPVGDA